jgi:hypothetical protein
VTPAGLHAAVLAALDAAAAAETTATPAPWFAAAQGRKIPVVGVAPTETERGRGLAVFGHTDAVRRVADADLVAALRNTAPAVYAGVRDILTRHAPEPWPANAGPAVVPASCSACHTGWWCPDYRAAARMIPNLPEEAADGLGHRP